MSTAAEQAETLRGALEEMADASPLTRALLVAYTASLEFRKQLRNAGLLRGRRGRLRDRIFTGHVDVGPVTVFGANAMHYAVTVSTERGYVCAHPTTGRAGHWGWYIYVSPDATPGRAWWGIGPGFDL